MPRAPSHQKVRDRSMRPVVLSIPAGGPANHFQLMIVTVPHDVAACISQTTDDVEVAGCSRPVHCVRVVACLTSVGVQSARQQQIDRSKVSSARSEMQQRPRIGLGPRVQHLRVLVEQVHES